jgi:hypothetical protein
VLGIGRASVHRVLEGGWHRADERLWRIRLGGALCDRLPEEGTQAKRNDGSRPHDGIYA